MWLCWRGGGSDWFILLVLLLLTVSRGSDSLGSRDGTKRGPLHCVFRSCETVRVKWLTALRETHMGT